MDRDFALALFRGDEMRQKNRRTSKELISNWSGIRIRIQGAASPYVNNDMKLYIAGALRLLLEFDIIKWSCVPSVL